MKIRLQNTGNCGNCWTKKWFTFGRNNTGEYVSRYYGRGITFPSDLSSRLYLYRHERVVHKVNGLQSDTEVTWLTDDVGWGTVLIGGERPRAGGALTELSVYNTPTWIFSEDSITLTVTAVSGPGNVVDIVCTWSNRFTPEFMLTKTGQDIATILGGGSLQNCFWWITQNAGSIEVAWWPEYMEPGYGSNSVVSPGTLFDGARPHSPQNIYKMDYGFEYQAPNPNTNKGGYTMRICYVSNPGATIRDKTFRFASANNPELIGCVDTQKAPCEGIIVFNPEISVYESRFHQLDFDVLCQ